MLGGERGPDEIFDVRPVSRFHQEARTRIESAVDGRWIAARGEHERGRRAAVRSRVPENVETVSIRKRHVDEERRPWRFQRHFLTFRDRGSVSHLPVRAKRSCERRAKGSVIVDDEEHVLHDGTLGPRNEARKATLVARGYTDIEVGSVVAREVLRVLIVEDDASLRRAIVRAMRSTGRELDEASTCEGGLALLANEPDLLLLDVRLPDGSGVKVAQAAAALRPAPLVVVLSGEATPQEAFQLAQLGAIQFLAKPFSLDELLAAIELVHTARVQLAPMVRACVGSADLRDVQDDVRRTMVEQALALAKGNRTMAAKLLRVSRQAIQKFIRTTGIEP